MVQGACSVCDLPRVVYKCAKCGRFACLACYSGRRARCEPCLRQDGRRLRRGLLHVFN